MSKEMTWAACLSWDLCLGGTMGEEWKCLQVLTWPWAPGGEAGWWWFHILWGDSHIWIYKPCHSCCPVSNRILPVCRHKGVSLGLISTIQLQSILWELLWEPNRELTDGKATSGKAQTALLVKAAQKLVIDLGIWMVHFDQETWNGWVWEVGCNGVKRTQSSPCSCANFSSLFSPLLFFWSFRATPVAYGSSQARVKLELHLLTHPQPQQCGIQTTSATYTTAHGNAGSKIHWVGPGINPASSWIPVRFLTTEPQRELHSCADLQLGADVWQTDLLITSVQGHPSLQLLPWGGRSLHLAPLIADLLWKDADWNLPCAHLRGGGGGKEKWCRRFSLGPRFVRTQFILVLNQMVVPCFTVSFSTTPGTPWSRDHASHIHPVSPGPSTVPGT